MTQQNTSRSLMFVVNNPAFFLSHRLPIALAAKEQGYAVSVATMDGPAVQAIKAHGLAHHVLPMSRSGMNPLAELKTLYAIYRLFRKLRPDIVHLVTIKPVLYGGIAARLARVKGVVSAISGLGFIFTREHKGIDWVRLITQQLYRFALGHRNSRVIFQNRNDRDILTRIGAVRDEQVVMIRGSGVDLDQYAAVPEPPLPITIIFVARLLRDKGVLEYVEAAGMSRRDGKPYRWLVVGNPDPGNPASVTQEDAQSWGDRVQWLGERSDIAALYADSHIVVLPSYREGLPKSLVEAAACARAVITTDVPGCRDAIEADQTGVLVPVRDARAIYEAVCELAENTEKRHAMGQAGRALAQEAFDIRKVVQAHLDIYQVLER
ncbi:glycosyltransferase family 1 protein [Advenella sp. S44]|uniref:glycosyltransferase family 4 protein n=1 Tax=Advenella sp. S44 TaxID=1982755 RepID=UPI000C29D91A|nr:glycosyltransferase family 4 protein [Advenella sp. S44]PJX21090.1 glycosyltransferase family 1 protein [Advenella sp. S44]